ncbi:Vesicle transport protein [Actinidia chinensis var. chinensis]|uniref:Vesicle transport protein n=1 Tax=Actinidia chinensis var. chinensis TaxID=1590841 RepID=A0A2R6RCZ7_ACTCC|nr:Vesicle transport protein [Actinidia chinensis var. chinensis]
MASFEAIDMKKIGLGLTGFGVVFTVIGIFLLFDKGFIAMGNGSVSFGVGFFFVLIGWPMIGMIVETYGFIVLFSYLRGTEADECPCENPRPNKEETILS